MVSYIRTYNYTRDSSLNSNPDTMEPRPSPPSSHCAFTTARKKSGRVSKMLLFQLYNFFFKLRNLKLRNSGAYVVVQGTNHAVLG